MKVLLVGQTAQDMLSGKFVRLPSEKQNKVLWLTARTEAEFEEMVQVHQEITTVIFLDYIDRGNRHATAMDTTLGAMITIKKNLPEGVVTIASTGNAFMNNQLSKNGCSRIFCKQELWKWFEEVMS